jgi:hypothetical protein
MFSKEQIDQTGELPAPFYWDRYNFNGHSILGTFDYIDGMPRIIKSSEGMLQDKKNRRVTKYGWLVVDGHIVDSFGRKKLDKAQLTSDGDLPKLLNF